MRLNSVLVVDGLETTSDETSSTSGNQTNLLTSGSGSGHRAWVTNVLMVTTTMRMLNGVHSNTSDSWPLELLGVILVPGVVSLQQWLVGSLTTGYDTHHSSASSLDGSSHTRRKSDTCLLAVFGMTDDDGRAA